MKKGAKNVYAVDLNDELLHDTLKCDKRVIEVVKNAKLLDKNDFDCTLDLIVADLSFISATMVMEVFSKLLDVGKNLILLIKPQFEVGGKRRFKNGIIRDKNLQNSACEKVISCAKEYGFSVLDLTTAPVVDGKNLEFLALFVKLK